MQIVLLITISKPCVLQEHFQTIIHVSDVLIVGLVMKALLHVPTYGLAMLVLSGITHADNVLLVLQAITSLTVVSTISLECVLDVLIALALN